MKARFNSVRQFCLTSSLAITTLLLSHAMSWGTVTTLTGNPGPGTYAIGAVYQESVLVNGAPSNANQAYLFSRQVGTAMWNFKGNFRFTGLAPNGIHTWNCSNYSSGSYEWWAMGDDLNGTAAASAIDGPYTSP